MLFYKVLYCLHKSTTKRISISILNTIAIQDDFKIKSCNNGIPKQISEPGFGTKTSKTDVLAPDISGESTGEYRLGSSGKVLPNEKTRSWRWRTKTCRLQHQVVRTTNIHDPNISNTWIKVLSSELFLDLKKYPDFNNLTRPKITPKVYSNIKNTLPILILDAYPLII